MLIRLTGVARRATPESDILHGVETVCKNSYFSFPARLAKRSLFNSKLAFANNAGGEKSLFAKVSDIKAIQIHHLRPSGGEVLEELNVTIATGVDFG